MDLRQLEAFCQIVETGSFSKASEVLSLTQPTVSGHIKNLEEELGVKLLDRRGRVVSPTKGGELLLRYAKRILEVREEACQAINKFLGKWGGSLFVGGSTIPGQYILPRLLGKFKERYPEISVALTIGDTRDIVERVSSGALELGIVGAKMDRGRLEYVKFLSDELVLVVPARHRWQGKHAIALRELREEPFILRERGSGSRVILEQALLKQGMTLAQLKIIAEMGSTEAVRQGIKSGLGISILSRLAVEEDLRYRHCSEIRVKGMRFKRDFYIAVNRVKTLSPLGEAFLDFLKAQTP